MTNPNDKKGTTITTISIFLNFADLKLKTQLWAPLRWEKSNASRGFQVALAYEPPIYLPKSRCRTFWCLGCLGLYAFVFLGNFCEEPNWFLCLNHDYRNFNRINVRSYRNPGIIFCHYAKMPNGIRLSCRAVWLAIPYLVGCFDHF